MDSTDQNMACHIPEDSNMQLLLLEPHFI